MFDAFAHGVDVSMQALTKYGGHGDLLLGAVSARDGCLRQIGANLSTAWFSGVTGRL